MSDVVHRDGSRTMTSYPRCVKTTWCEAIDDDTYFTSSSLHETDKPVTCIRCLGLT